MNTISILLLLDILQHGLHLTKKQSSSYVSVSIIKFVLLGLPGVGKTAFKSFLFNSQPILKHHSTAISSVPVRAMITSRMTETNNEKWLDIDRNPEQLFHMLADAIKYLAHALDIVVNKRRVCETSFIQTPIHVPIEFKTVTTEQLLPAPSSSSTAALAVIDPSELHDIVALLPKVKGSGELFDTKWVCLLDTGGQPQFADVSRAFVRTNSVYFIFSKLTEKLSDRPDLFYSENGKAFAAPSKLHMTNLQLIKHFVCSILSSKYEEGVADEDNTIVEPVVSVIGTHYDKYIELLSTDLPSMKFESIEEKNEILLEELKEFLNHFTYDGHFPDILIHPVNNLCTGSERSEASATLQKKLLTAIQDKLKPRKVKIPVHQYLFDILVKNKIKSSGKESHGVLTLDECNDIGKKLGIDVKDTLKLFDSLNLYLYFQPLQHVVFTNPQYLLSLLSKLIQVSFVDQPSIATNAPRVLKDTGIFDVTSLDKLDLQFVPPHFTKEHFLQLLKYTRIIASVSSTQYFLPAVLPPDELSLDKKLEFSATCDPLFIKFNCNIVPQVSTIY